MGEKVVVFTDPSVLPVYKALLARAEKLEEFAQRGFNEQCGHSVETAAAIAREFRALAEELRTGGG